MPGKDPVPKVGMCEHGRVRTLCTICRQALSTARPQPVAPRRRPTLYRGALKEQPEARVSCAMCSARGTARGFVEDVDGQQFLCRTHAADRTFALTTYMTSGRLVEAAAPSTAHWKDVLRDSRATSIRGFTQAPEPNTE